MMEGHIDHGNNFGFHFKRFGKPLGDFEQGSEMIRCMYGTATLAMVSGIDCWQWVRETSEGNVLRDPELQLWESDPSLAVPLIG